jgi:phosphoglycerate kinase
VLLLDNVRLCAEENLERKGEKLIQTNLVKRLAPLFELYVNDAFAAAHRSQASLVAFPHVLPAAAGKLLEKELAALKRLFSEPVRPSTYILGGAKVEDKVPVIDNILSTGKANYVLVGGNVGKVFLKAEGQKFSPSDEEELGDVTDEVLKASQILTRHKKHIILPSDFGTYKDGRRVDATLDKLSKMGRSLDIGEESARVFSAIIRRSKTVVANGPMGVFEQESFESGTKAVLEAMAETNAFTVIGGGHLVGYAGILGIADHFSHVSTAGGAMLSLLAGEDLPAITALVQAAKRHRKS